jgi:hypothetical protein
MSELRVIHTHPLPITQFSSDCNRFKAVSRRICSTYKKRCLGFRISLKNEKESDLENEHGIDDLKTPDKKKVQCDEKRGDYVWISNYSFLVMVKYLAISLMKYGVKKGDHVGILLPNRPEWVSLV